MSVPVDIDNLEKAIDKYGVNAYLITTDNEAHPHITHVTLSKDSDGFVCYLGRKTSANAAARPSVAMLWPPMLPGEHSLIVDGLMQVTEIPERGARGLFKPKAAILHRSASGSEKETAGNCTSDCSPVITERR